MAPRCPAARALLITRGVSSPRFPTTSRVIDAARAACHRAGVNQPNRKEAPMPDVTDIVDSYIATWNEHDPARRRALMTQTFSEH
jgi:hypothetical protein